MNWTLARMWVAAHPGSRRHLRVFSPYSDDHARITGDLGVSAA